MKSSQPHALLHRLVAALVVPAFLGALLWPHTARAWKPHTHSLTVNNALHDARDAHVCIPGLSTQQIPIGETDLVGSYQSGGGWKRFNDLRSMGRYVRAGVMGPDAYPDAVWGQLATHVDHTKRPPAEPAVDHYMNGLIDALFGVDPNVVLGPLTDPYQRWRAIDWAHEVLAQAYAFHAEELAGKSRTQILADPRLKKLFAERQASIAFAYGYLMHFAGDSFAHAWVNEWSDQPFYLFEGRSDFVEGVPPSLAAAVEEFQHMAIEKYVDEAYEPTLVGDGCSPVAPSFTTDVTSICDGDPNIPFELPCDYCNPLREGGVPPDVALSGACDHCFVGCNPWREICPMALPEGLACAGECTITDPDGQTYTREEALERCEDVHGDPSTCNTARKDCVESVEDFCLDKALSSGCCVEAGMLFVDQGIMTAEQLKTMCFTAPASGRADAVETAVAASRGSVLGQPSVPATVKNRIVAGAPCGCFQGPLGPVTVGQQVTVQTPSGPITLGPADGEIGALIDFNSDGQPDLINECMFWNCMLSPGSKNCPLNGLREQVPEQEIAGGLTCEQWNQTQLDGNPSPLLEAVEIDVPLNFYRKVFLERRFPEGARPGAFGTSSLGGPAANGIYVVTDLLVAAEVTLNTLDSPLTSLIDECVIGGNDSGDACEVAFKITMIKAFLLASSAMLAAIGAALQLFIVPSVFFYTLAGIALATYALLESGVLPGISIPLAGMRARLKHHLEVEWPKRVAATAQGMSGYQCPSTCGQPQDGTCSDHRFMAIDGYIDWAVEAYDIIDSFDCSDNNYVTKIIAGNVSLSDLKNLLTSAGGAIITQYLACHVGDFFYKRHFAGPLKELIGKTVIEETAGFICQTADFYRNAAIDQGVPFEPDAAYEERCIKQVQTFYNDAAANVPDLALNLKALLTLLDSGNLPPDRKAALHAELNRVLGMTTGVQVDFTQLEALGNVFDCGVHADIVQTISARDMLINAFIGLVAADDPAAAAQAHAFVDEIDRQMGVVSDLSPIPVADVNRFYPLYNTIQLNKLILLGDGSAECERIIAECKGVNSTACTEAENACKLAMTQGLPGTAILNAGATGLLKLVQVANAKPLGKAFEDADDPGQLDAAPASYLPSLFQEEWVVAGSGAATCKGIKWNVMCNSVYSLDDPDDYCRDVKRWNNAFSPPLASDENLEDFYECGKFLRGIDDFGSGVLLDGDRYAPSSRDIVGPDNDPRNSDYNTLRAFGDHVTAPNRRSTRQDHVVRHHVSVTETAADDFMNDPVSTSLALFRNTVFNLVARPGVFWGAVLPAKTGGTRTVRLARWLATAMAPFTTVRGPSTEFYPYDLTRFALGSTDAHVARLYSRVFAPFYCPEAGAGQSDNDCDAVPDACDLCPATYNPDQLDADRDGFGDDCPGYNPLTGATPAAQQSTRCVVTSSAMPAGLVDRLTVIGQQSLVAFKSTYCANAELKSVGMFTQWCLDGDAPSCPVDKYATCADWTVTTMAVVPPAVPRAPYVPLGSYKKSFAKVCDMGPLGKPVCKADLASAKSWCTAKGAEEVAKAKTFVPTNKQSLVTLKSATTAATTAPAGQATPTNHTWFECKVTINEPIPTLSARASCGCTVALEN